jgi:hypothetical protein
VVKLSLPERLLLAVLLGLFWAAFEVERFAHPHGAALKLWAVLGVVASIAALALFVRRWLLAKLHLWRHPELQPHEPNYNRTPYV